MKKGIAICLVAVLILCSVSGLSMKIQAEENIITMTEFYESGATSARNKVITIGTRDELNLLRSYVAEGKSTASGTFRLIRDIYWSNYEFQWDETSKRIGVYRAGELVETYSPEDCLFFEDYISTESIANKLPENQQWEIIGTDDYTMAGDFDGNGYTIHGLWSENQYYSALFREMYGDIKNLTVENYFSVQSTYASSLCSKNYGNISDCNVKKAYIMSEKALCAGGLVESMGSGTTISDCQVDVMIYIVNVGEKLGSIYLSGLAVEAGEGSECKNNVVSGKIVGYTYRPLGGVIAYAKKDILIENCKSNVEIEGSASHVGGIAGYISGDLSRIEACENNGNITIKEGRALGGTIGECFGNHGLQPNAMSISECTNRGNLQGRGKVGGILGMRKGRIHIKNSKNEGNILSDLDSYFDDGTETTPAAGGIYGGDPGEDYSLHNMKESKIENCANLGTVSSLYGISGGIVGETGTEREQFDITNCYSCGTVMTEEGKRGSIVGSYDVGSVSYCYYMTGEGEAVGEKSEKSGEQSIRMLYPITESQLLGTENQQKIGASGYAWTYTLCEALNHWVEKQEENTYYGWVQTDKGPVWQSGLYLPKPTPKPTATPTATPTPSPKPTVTPTATPTQKPMPAVTPTAVPTSKPTPTTVPENPSTWEPVRQTPVPEEKTTSSAETKKKKNTKLSAPGFSLKKKRTSTGKRYVEIKLKAYQGNYIEIMVKKKGGKQFYKLKIRNNNIRKLKKKFNFQYKKQKGTMIFKIRTYKKKNGKRIYSYWSKEKKVRLT